MIAATNFPDKIDAALRRAGRLDREIRIEKPGIGDLAQIFRHHLTDAFLAGVDLKVLALAARGGTGADVESYVRRAKGAARRAQRDLEIDDVLDQIRDGRSALNAEVRYRVAVHEAGHVVVARKLGVGRFLGVSVHETGGAAEFENVVDGSRTSTELDDIIVVTLAGRAAERLLLGNMACGSARGSDSDLARATLMAEEMESRFGAGHLGNVYLPENFQWLGRVPGLLEAVRVRLDLAEMRAGDILAGNVEWLKNIIQALDARGYLAPADVEELLLASPLIQEAAE